MNNYFNISVPGIFFLHVTVYSRHAPKWNFWPKPITTNEEKVQNRNTERNYYANFCTTAVMGGTVYTYLTKVRALQLHKLIFILQRINQLWNYENMYLALTAVIWTMHNMKSNKILNKMFYLPPLLNSLQAYTWLLKDCKIKYLDS